MINTYSETDFFVDILIKYFPLLSPRQQKQFAQLAPLYQEWNEKINVISRKDIEQLYERHILHSLGIAKVIDFKPDARILDVGTGGGFPGIPLAILFPDTHFHLIDSIGKKIKVVQEVSAAIGLKNLTAEQIRAEDVRHTYDFIVSRAVTNMKDFHTWVKNKVHTKQQHNLRNGILYLKGGDLTEELLAAKIDYQLFTLSTYFEEEFFETKYVVYVPF